ncbi:hypothetical protein TNCV_137811 [Trichonephila clavipes]|nr:hypothetical protein TNCV_137811 [Trichonephila clavipes]
MDTWKKRPVKQRKSRRESQGEKVKERKSRRESQGEKVKERKSSRGSQAQKAEQRKIEKLRDILYKLLLIGMLFV